MSWEKSSAPLVELFAELAPRDPGVEQRQMFGWPCCFFGGNLFLGLHRESMIFRLPEAERGELLRQPGAALFSPMPGRPMKEYVAVAGPLGRPLARLRPHAAAEGEEAGARRLEGQPREARPRPRRQARRLPWR